MSAEVVAAPVITSPKRGSYAIDGRPVVGVTTAIKGGWPSPALTYWAADETARFAVEHPTLVQEVGAVKAYERIRRSPWRERDRKAAAGTSVHALAEPLARGEEIDVPPELVPYVDACLRFLTERDVTVLYAEAVVANARWSYAGRLDLIADTSHGRAIIDYKTAQSGIFPETALQLAAYRHAEWLVDGFGTAIPMPGVDLCAACWLKGDGTYELRPVVADEATFRTFLYAAQIAAATGADREAFIGAPLAP